MFLIYNFELFQFYTCGAEGFWRPSPGAPDGAGGAGGGPGESAPGDPSSAPFVYPACSVTRPAQKIFKIKLDYLTDVLCNDAGKVTRTRGERERDRERETERERERESDRERERDRETERHRDSQTDARTDGQTLREQVCGKTDRH